MQDPGPSGSVRFRWSGMFAPSVASPRWLYLAGGVISALAALALVDSGPTTALLVVAAACALALVTRPFIALCAVVSLISLEALNTIQPSEIYSFTGIKLFGLVLVISLIPEVVLQRLRLRFGAGFMALGFLFLGIMGSLVNAVNIRSAVSGVLTFAQLAILWAAVQQLVDTRRRLRILGKVAVCTLTVSAVLAVGQFLLDPRARVSGTSQNAAILSADLFVALGFGFALWSTALSKSSQWVWRIVVGLAALGILVTLSRAAYVAFFLALLSASVFMGKGGRGMVTALVVALALLLFAPFAVDRLAETSIESDPSTRGHLYSLSAGARMMWDHPIFGVGIGNYTEHYLRYTNDERGLPRSAHNSYLAIGAEMGVPALLAFLALHLFAFRSLWLRSREHLSRGNTQGLVWCASIAFALTGFVLIGLLHSLEIAKYLWILLALAIQPSQSARRAEEA